MSDIPVRDETKQVRADERRKARKNRERIRRNTLRIFLGRERSRCQCFLRRSRKVDVGQAPSRWSLVAAAASFLLLLASGCTKQDPYVPPDLFYYFASYKVGKNPTTVTPTDVNQDGFTDLVTTNMGSNTLSILLGNGDGTFGEQVELSVCKEPRSLALGLFNSDPLPDVVLACSGADEVAILFGRADGKFQEGTRYPVHRTPIAIAIDDLNGDQALDFVVALRNDKIKVFLGTGTGEFTHGAQYEYGDTPTSVALADLDGDGKVDLAVTNGGPMSNAVSIWMGNGNGTFRPPTDYRTGKRPLGVSFADFNHDRIRDLLVINGVKDSFTTFLGIGNGTFQPGHDSGADAGPNFGLARDFNGDRRTDVAIVNLQSSDLSILFGRDDGTFEYPPRNYKTKPGPFALASFHVTTKDTEEPGLVTADNGNQSVSIFLHRGLKASSASIAPAP
ncbi:MAG TPA: VCBS repeat-containing protein [Nitrospiraceae bacterium]|nr:VCBS repeat-containing protein [Nitrospiraceae bacterium]